ncbi:MAG TPA: cyclic nucleotide-binding domain-containing protein [Steroidobacteraceae bacterium]
MHTLLKKFTPFDALKEKNLREFALKTQVQTLGRGRQLIKQGDRDNKSYFLVSGSVELRINDRLVGVIKAGTAEARTALSPTTPRQCAVRTVDDIQYFCLENESLDALVTWDKTGFFEVAELKESGNEGVSDWQTALLQTPALHRIPPANIQTIFMRMQRVNHRAGEVVIKQGSEGDYFYVIAAGKCIVRRETPLQKDGLKLAELESGMYFGEEALITGARRNATVAMLTDGAVMRLNKADFLELLYEPQVRWVDYAKAQDLVAKGARWLDVRVPGEQPRRQIPDAINLPLQVLRLKMAALASNIPYVIYCDTGRMASAAAFLMTERGYKAYVLKGGLADNALAGASSGG